jgi:pimeloyl-ACP methyl ester carboxylesterase
MSEIEKPTFVTEDGTWFDDRSWRKPSRLLRARGYGCETPKQDTSDSRYSLNDFAKQKKSFIKHQTDGDRTILLAHSRGANIAALVAKMIVVRGIILINGSLQPEALGLDEFDLDTPEKYGEGFLESIHDCGDLRTFITADAAIGLMFHDCDEQTASEAANQLNSQRQATYDRPPGGLPNVPIASIISTGDRVINPEHQRYIADKYLGGNSVEISGGHCPQISRPQELTEAVIYLANEFILPAATY